MVEMLEGMLRDLEREDPGSVADVVRVSGEKRQILKALEDAREREARAQADKDLAESTDPAVIAAALLRALPEVARADPELGVEIRDVLIAALPLDTRNPAG